jgi:hypothetical protein
VSPTALSRKPFPLAAGQQVTDPSSAVAMLVALLVWQAHAAALDGNGRAKGCAMG